MGMTSEELGRMTPRRFMNKYKGWRKEKLDSMSFIRLNTYRIMQSSGNMKQHFQLSQVYPLVGEDKLKPYLNKEETEDLLDRWGRTLEGYEPMTVKDFKRLAVEKQTQFLNGQ